MSTDKLTWHRVADKSEITADEPLGVKVGDNNIGLYLLDGDIFALENVCTHEFAILTDGFVEGDCIECPIHQALFDIRTGKAMSLPAEIDVDSYPVKLDGNDVLVGLAKK